MKEFWAIVPALSLSYLEAMVAAKDKLGKRGKDGLGAMFTDEGFALGVAYLLRVLGVDKAFDNIHWHASVIRHYSQERKAVQTEAARLGAGALRRGFSLCFCQQSATYCCLGSSCAALLTHLWFGVLQISALRRRTWGWAAGSQAATRCGARAAPRVRLDCVQKPLRVRRLSFCHRLPLTLTNHPFCCKTGHRPVARDPAGPCRCIP